MRHTLKTLALLLAAALTFASCGKDDEKEDLFTIIVNSNNAAWGTTYGSGEYAAGTELQIAATPVMGYKFVKWADENTDNPRTITVTAHAAYTALFADINSGSEDPGDDPGNDDPIPADSNAHCTITLGDTTWQGLIMVKQTVGNLVQMTIMSDENGEQPSVTFHFPGSVGTFHYDPQAASVYYMNNFSDFDTIQGNPYPHYLCVGECTINITEYDLNNTTITGTITARLLDMEREAQGLPEKYETLTVEFEKFFFNNYSK